MVGVAVVMETVLYGGVLEEAATFSAAYPIPERGMMLYFSHDGACSVPVSSVAELRELVTR